MIISYAHNFNNCRRTQFCGGRGGWGPGSDLGPGPLRTVLCLSSRREVGRKGWDTGVGLDKGPCILASNWMVGHLPLMGDGNHGS